MLWAMGKQVVTRDLQSSTRMSTVSIRSIRDSVVAAVRSPTNTLQRNSTVVEEIAAVRLPTNTLQRSSTVVEEI